jgi:hypothetical protein
MEGSGHIHYWHSVIDQRYSITADDRGLDNFCVVATQNNVGQVQNMRSTTVVVPSGERYAAWLYASLVQRQHSAWQVGVGEFLHDIHCKLSHGMDVRCKRGMCSEKSVEEPR